MKRIAIFVLFLAILAACGGETNRQAIEKEIASHRQEVNELNGKIKQLRQQLDTMEGQGDAFLTPVRLKPLQPETFSHFVEINGKVDTKHNARVSPETNGQIKEIAVEEGQRVRKGQVLIKLGTEITESTIEEVKTSLDLAEKVFEKQKRLWEQEIGSELEFLRAKNNVESLKSRLNTLQRQLDLAVIEAPFPGIVDAIYQKEGELASPGRPVLHIVNLAHIQVEASISEKYLALVQAGDTVEINFPAYPGLRVRTPIRRVGNVINPDNRTYIIEMAFPNQNNKIKPNMISRVRVNDYQKDSAKVVPARIVKEDMQGKHIYIAQENDKQWVAKKVYVEAGRSYNDLTVIEKGLGFGDRVIIDGYSQVSNGTEIRISDK